jgi:hypothetical protein
MKKKGILLIGVILLSTAGLVQAQEELGVDLDVTWVSKYIWRGIDRLDDTAALQPSINLDLYGTGLSAKIWASYAGGGGRATNSMRTGTLGRVNATEYDYTLAYNCTLYEGEDYVTDVTANFIYYDFIDEPDRAQDAQELGVGFAWPNICPTGVVPSYYVGRIWPARSNSTLTGEYSGWLHVFGLGYDLTVPGVLPDMPEQLVKLSAALVYNDGFAGATVKHDWSHATFGAAAPIDIGEVTFTPAIYYQSSFEDSVNTSDEFYTGLSLSYSF